MWDLFLSIILGQDSELLLEAFGAMAELNPTMWHSSTMWHTSFTLNLPSSSRRAAVNRCVGNMP